MGSVVKAITFDLWDTIIDDNSDEPKRFNLGLRSKREERQYLLYNVISKYHKISEEEIKIACAVVDEAFLKCWKEYSITWTYRTRIDILLAGLGLTLPDTEFETLENSVTNMEIDIFPEKIDGIKSCLVDLSSRYKLCIISDTIFTPGRGLRTLLELHGIAQFFSGFAFSDEVGHSKPHIDMFKSASKQMGCEINEMIHVGDRNHNDVVGPQSLGMKAVLFVGKRDDDKTTTSAEAICESHGELPGIIERLAANG